MAGRRARWLSVCALVSVPQVASADAVLTPNQIKGRVALVTSNPVIAAALEEHPLFSSWIRGTSVGRDPALRHATSGKLVDAGSLNYELTVESAGPGIEYELNGALWLRPQDRYELKTQRSGAVHPEPADDIALDLTECVGLVDIAWVDQDGQPRAVGDATIHAWGSLAGNTRLAVQAYSTPSGSTSRSLIVPGDGSTYDVKITYAFSTANGNPVQWGCSKQVVVGCDEVAPITCVIPSGNGAYGTMSGTYDMVGETERPAPYPAFIEAYEGPGGNGRRLESAGGAFVFEDLVPSATDGYAVVIRGMLGEGRDIEYFTAPYVVGQYNGGERIVLPGQDTSLGSLHVMTPAEIVGSVRLRGPVGERAKHWLEHLVFPDDPRFDYDNDGVPDTWFFNTNSSVTATGTSTPDPTTGYSTYGEWAAVGYRGSYDAGEGQYIGEYRLRVAGLDGGGGEYVSSQVFIESRIPGPVSGRDNPMRVSVHQRSLATPFYLAPDERKRVDRELCVSEVEVGFATTNGTFWGPALRGSGSHSGLTEDGTMLNQYISLHSAQGETENGSSRGSTGVVRLLLPQGQYNLRPEVHATNPGGGDSLTELPALPLIVGCRQSIKVATDLQIALDDVGTCPALAEATVQGTVAGALSIDHVTFENNGESATTLCSDCGENPQFQHSFVPDHCQNDIEITATDQRGNTASVAASLSDDTAPVMSACPDITRRAVATGDASMFVDYDLSATDSCQPQAEVQCDIPSGSFFSYGTTIVHCEADDGCGNTAACEFDVTILRQEDPGDGGDPQDPGTPYDPGECTDGTVPEPVAFPGVVKSTLFGDGSLVDVGLSLSPAYECANMTMSAPAGEFGVRVEVWSDEPALTSGVADAEWGDRLRLRSGRHDDGDGRVYLLRAVADPAAEDPRATCSAVVVPHANTPADLEAVHRQARQALTHCGLTGQAPSDFHLHAAGDADHSN